MSVSEAPSKPRSANMCVAAEAIASLVVEGGRVVAVEPVSGPVPDRTLTPGFVDLQVNGLDDVDVADPGDRWPRLDGLLAAGGVTTWCPTLVTAPIDAYPARL